MVENNTNLLYNYIRIKPRRLNNLNYTTKVAFAAFLFFGGVFMHIPDNYLSPSTCAVFGAAMIPAWRRAVKKIKDEIPRKKIPMLGIGAAFSFLIMMFNLPLPGGTTGHAVGAVLVAILLGPYSACIAVTASLLVQALFFGDGGVLAFGANCFNMAFIMPFSGYYTFSILKKYFKKEKRRVYSILYCSIYWS